MSYTRAKALQLLLLLLPFFIATVNSGEFGASGNCDSYTCGSNARCTMSEGRPVCSYVNLSTENSIVRSVQIGHTQAACTQNTCGTNARCEEVNGAPSCICPKDYQGNPWIRCYECENDRDCPYQQACSSSFKCESPCKCGENAECQVFNHRAKCVCPNTWIGNPYVACRPECTSHSECPLGKPACLNQKCVNPCDGVCGVNADCNLRGIIPVCSCPKHMTGNPFVACRLFEPRDLCQPNPCGSNAVCTPGHDNTGKERPVCTCPAGYIGNALTSCQRGECLTNVECPNNRACIDFTCQNPCTGRECGVNAVCTPRRHIAVCTCPQSTRGDALYACSPIDTKSVYNYGRAYRYRYY